MRIIQPAQKACVLTRSTYNLIERFSQWRVNFSSSVNFSIDFESRDLDFLKYFRNRFDSLVCSVFLTLSIAQ